MNAVAVETTGDVTVKPRFKTYKQISLKEDPIAIYDFYGAEVTGDILLANCYPIPLTPIYRTWNNLVQQYLRCDKCWTEVFGPEDLKVHNINEHKAMHCGESC